MRTRAITVTAATVAALLLASSPLAQSPAIRDDAHLLRRFAAWATQAAREDRFAGTVLVARRGATIYEGAFGLADRETRVPVTLETPFNICSMGKMFTAFAAMLLVEEGRLDLRAPIARYLPDFPRPAADRITLHHLLSHTSGLGNYMAHPDFFTRAPELTTTAAVYGLVRAEASAFEPGARFSYSNSGFVAVGRILESVTGQPYAEVIRRRVFGPLGMSHTHFYLPDRRPRNAARGYVRDERGRLIREPAVVPAPGPDGGVHSTVRDLLAFDRALHEGSLLSARAKRLMMTPNLRDYGYGLTVANVGPAANRRTVVGHTGGLPDRSTVLRRYVEDGLTLIVLTNLSTAARDAVREFDRLYLGESAR